MVVIVDADKLAKLQMTSKRSSFGSNAFHGAPVTKEAESIVVDKLISGLVENGSGMCLSNGNADSIRETLTKRASGDLNTRGIMLSVWSDFVRRNTFSKNLQLRGDQESCCQSYGSSSSHQW